MTALVVSRVYLILVREVTIGSLENFFSDKTTSEKYTLWLLNQRAEKKGPKLKLRRKRHLQMMMMDKIIKSKPDRL